jgi:seryl-tRNA synthetase
MLDIQLLRKDLPAAIAGLKRRGFDFDEAAFRALEDERKKLQSRTEELQNKRNTLSKQIGILKGKKEDASAVMAEVAGLGDELKANETALAANREKQEAFLRVIPNIPRADVPDGKSSDDNVEVRRWGEPRTLDFAPRDHVDLGAGSPAWTSKPPPGSRARASTSSRGPSRGFIGPSPSSCSRSTRRSTATPRCTCPTW